VGLAMRGLVPPNEELRRLAPQFLGVPLKELFTGSSILTGQPEVGPVRRA